MTECRNIDNSFAASQPPNMAQKMIAIINGARGVKIGSRVVAMLSSKKLHVEHIGFAS